MCGQRGISDTIKALSDFGVNASIVLIGVADSVTELVAGHGSIERALVQIPMPRMSAEEIAQIVENGLARLGMTIDQGAKSHLVHLAQGVPTSLIYWLCTAVEWLCKRQTSLPGHMLMQESTDRWTSGTSRSRMPTIKREERTTWQHFQGSPSCMRPSRD